jgi:hypothetical protein
MPFNPFVYMVLLLAIGLGLASLGAWAVAWFARRKALDGPARERRIAAGEYPAWRAGEDLTRHPARLEDLEARLARALAETELQAEHLRERAGDLQAKDGRSDLAGRYREDAALLERRLSRMRRVLAMVWRTRSTLVLRAHVAITARARPALESLPQGQVAAEALPAAAEAYDAAAARVRDFVVRVEARRAELEGLVPPAPPLADVEPADREAVDEERRRARRTYADLQDRMDRLADTLAYLADRCRTRRVVEGTVDIGDGVPGGEGLADELGAAVAALHALAEEGDQQLQESTMEHLSEGISQLEQAGLDARAEADAALEVARLLDQVAGRAPAG